MLQKQYHVFSLPPFNSIPISTLPSVVSALLCGKMKILLNLFYQFNLRSINFQLPTHRSEKNQQLKKRFQLDTKTL